MITYSYKQGGLQKLDDLVASWKTKLLRVTKIEWAKACIKESMRTGKKTSISINLIHNFYWGYNGTDLEKI